MALWYTMYLSVTVNLCWRTIGQGLVWPLVMVEAAVEGLRESTPSFYDGRVIV